MFIATLLVLLPCLAGTLAQGGDTWTCIDKGPNNVASCHVGEGYLNKLQITNASVAADSGTDLTFQYTCCSWNLIPSANITVCYEQIMPLTRYVGLQRS